MARQVPVLDIAGYIRAPDSAAGQEFVRALREACSGSGFCQIVGHPVEPEQNQAIVDAARAFFDLPVRERQDLAIVNSPHFRGYTLLGDERTQGISDWREQIDFGGELAPRPPKPGDPPWQRLRGPNQWPPGLPAMKDTVLDWMRAMEGLGLAVGRALAQGLGQPATYFEQYFLPEGDAKLKLIRYPAQDRTRETGQGVGLHQDSGFLTFVLQDRVGGLQVQMGDDLVGVTPLPGAFVLNLGEMLQAATGGYLRATKHRVASPPAGVERLSIAYFHNPRLEATLKPMTLPADLVTGDFDLQDEDPKNRIFTTFGENQLKLRLRSHPDVARAHYADLLDPVSGVDS